MSLARDNPDSLRISSVDLYGGLIAITQIVTSYPLIWVEDPGDILFRTLTRGASSVPKLKVRRRNLTRSKSLEVGYFFDVKYNVSQ